MEPSLAGATILVGIDFSGSSERALLHAVGLAERESAQLELVHVFEWDTPLANEQVPAQRPSTPEHLQSLTCAARRRLAELCSWLVGDRVPAEIQVRIGDPAQELRRAIEQTPASLLVLSAHDRRSLAGGAIGHTADRICRSSPVPVLLVAPDSATGEGQVLLHSARGQILWEDSSFGAARHCAAGHAQPGSHGLPSSGVSPARE